MNPVRSAVSDASIQFVETFIGDPVDAIQARRAAHDLGIQPVSSATARVLTLLTQLTSATAVAEIGTGTGVSALAFFAGMSPDGIVTSVDREPQHQFAARDCLKAAGISHTRYRLIAGEALAVLPKLRAEAYDIVFIDADFLEYPEYLEESLRIIRPGGFVILNHVLLDGKVADETNFDDDTMVMRDTVEAARDMDNLTCAIIPVGDGLMVCATSPAPDANLV